MYKYLLCLPMLVVCNFTALAQHSFRATILDETTGEALIGASIYLPELNKGGVSDANGFVSIPEIPTGSYVIQISYVGYEKLEIERAFPLLDSLQDQIFYLLPGHGEMEEVVISSTRSSRTIEDTPSRVEFIAGEELAEKGNMKPGDIRMLLNESTGIQTQQTSATSYNSSIRIQGLDGKYTQLLRDGFPLYSGFSSGLSLMQIAPLDLKQVEVIKGSSSTLYGGGAIAGLVNLISKTPGDEPELSFMFNGTSALGFDASGFYSDKSSKIGTTVFASYNKGTAYDPAEIGLTAIPDFDRFTLNPRLFLYFNDRTRMNVGFSIITENRLGGNMNYIEGREVADPYFEQNKTDRLTAQFNLQHKLSESSHLEIKNSINYYDRTIDMPDFIFSGVQTSSFSEVNYSTFNERSEWVAGINVWTDNFNQTQGSLNQNLDFSNATIGAFGQNIWSIAKHWTLETGFRADYQSDYGFFPLPRLSVMIEPSDKLTFRLGGGLGYKTPAVFSEDSERLQFQNILPIDTDQTEAERSMGGNFDINYRWAISNELTLYTNTLLFYTKIRNPLALSSAGSAYEFIQPEGYVDTKGVEMNMKWAYHDFKLFVGYTFADVNEHYNNETTEYPLVSKHRLNNVLMYEKHNNFWIGLEAYYFSPQKIGGGSTSQSYWIMGLMTEKTFGKHIALFLNFENFLDVRQTAFDTIFTGSVDNPQFKDIYAPVDGFVINGGIKITR